MGITSEYPMWSGAGSSSGPAPVRPLAPGTGLITVSWVLCDCPPALATQERAGGPAGPMAVFCNASPGCRSVWYRPRCGHALGACRGPEVDHGNAFGRADVA